MAAQRAALAEEEKQQETHRQREKVFSKSLQSVQGTKAEVCECYWNFAYNNNTQFETLTHDALVGNGMQFECPERNETTGSITI